MPTVVDTITKYSSKDVQGKYGPSKLTTFYTQSGLELTTFKAEIASQANMLMNQPVKIEYEQVQKGEYTNYYLQSVEPASAANMLMNQQSVEPDDGIAPLAENNVTPITSAPSHPSNIDQTDFVPSSKDHQIARAVALKAAVDTLPVLEDKSFTSDPAKILALAEFYYEWLL